MHFLRLYQLFATASAVLACDNCYGPSNPQIHNRLMRRMQPEALNATTGPSGPLAWGQLNFLHTTDTHGWLEGHLKEHNYGADWGDFVSFVRHMKHTASDLGVDLLLIDTGDLHDGAGLSDATTPNGLISNPIFEEIDYDLLTIGNHELYVAAVANETFLQFSETYGNRYLTSNVQILSNGSWTYIGEQYRYFTTPHGLRIMSFGVLYNFTGNANNTRVIKAGDMIQQSWFFQAVNTTDPIDLFLLIGHNPVRPSASTSTMGIIQSAIRKIRPDVPIQVFGGHTHIRDFYVYDSSSTGLESGRYCETLGWLSMSGINSSTFSGSMKPAGVPNPTQKAVKVNGTASSNSTTNNTTSSSGLVYSRRYLDWNRLTFAYHANTSQDGTFDYSSGLRVSEEITSDRKSLNLTTLYGCAPQTYCVTCKPFLANGSIYGLIQTALAATIVNETRAKIPRLIIINTGSIRFDLVQGPFTVDDSYIVSPFADGFQYIPDVPYYQASQVLAILNAGPYQKKHKRDRNLLSPSDFAFTDTFSGADGCVDTPYQKNSAISRVHSHDSLKPRSTTRDIKRRQSVSLSPGYTTKDDFGTEGDDTPHSAIPAYSVPVDVQANASFFTNGSLPDTVDLIFLDFIAEEYVLPALASIGLNYTMDDVSYYMPTDFTTNSYLPVYAKMAWSQGPNCITGEGVQ